MGEDRLITIDDRLYTDEVRVRTQDMIDTNYEGFGTVFEMPELYRAMFREGFAFLTDITFYLKRGRVTSKLKIEDVLQGLLHKYGALNPNARGKRTFVSLYDDQAVNSTQHNFKFAQPIYNDAGRQTFLLGFGIYVRFRIPDDFDVASELSPEVTVPARGRQPHPKS